MRKWIILALAASVCGASGCLPAKSKPVYEERFSMSGGEGRAFTLEPGTYDLELASHGGSVSVEWIGGSCPRVDRTDSLFTTCELTHEGQLVVRHPGGDAGPIEITLNVRRERR